MLKSLNIYLAEYKGLLKKKANDFALAKLAACIFHSFPYRNMNCFTRYFPVLF